MSSTSAIVDLSHRGRIRVTGEDRKRLLHAMTTNHVEQMQPGSSLYAFFLNAQGRVLADGIIYCFEDHLLLSVEPEVRAKVIAHLDKFIIADDVTVEDVTESTGEYSIEGPDEAGDAATTETGLPGRRFIVERGAVPAGAISTEETRVLRLEQGRPRYGDDISEVYIAHETAQLRAIHPAKGCYLGQEIVERVRSRGHVNRKLTHMRIEGAGVPSAGEKIFAGGKEVGEVTSAAYSPRWSAVAALGYLRAGAESQELYLREGTLRVSVL